MRQLLLTLFFMFILLNLGFAVDSDIYLNSGDSNKLELSEDRATQLTINTNISHLKAGIRKTPWGEFTVLQLPEFDGYAMEAGDAMLPEIHQLIDIPYGAEPQVRVIASESREINLSEYGFTEEIMPYQGPIVKTTEAVQNHQFKKNNAYYATVKYHETDLVSIKVNGNLRGHRLAQLIISPVQYAPASNRVRVFYNIQIEISFPGADLSRTNMIHRKYDSPYFSPVLNEFLLNYSPASRDLTVYPVHYVMIYYDAFQSALQPLIEWKEQKGFKVTATPVSSIGNSTAAITAYIQSLYNGPEPPTFVVLVGDKEQITTYNGQTGSHVTDLYYTTMTSGDYIPDLYIGRLSAMAEPQLTAQINKILYHEQYQFTQTTFLDHGCFAATDDSYNYQVAEGSHNHVINTHFTPNNLQTDKLYAITYNATGQDVLNAVNAGRFILNYSGHGSTTSWGGPSVNQAMVNSSTNQNMYPFVISNACLTGSFEVTECFGETWVRKANGGGLAFTGASNSTYWSEDDDWERRAYDGVFWQDYHTIGAFMFRGNLAVFNGGYSRAKYYFEVYHLFGDPSVMLYWGEPSSLTVSSSPVVYLGTPVYDVTVSEDSAMVSLFMDGENYGCAISDASGLAQIQLDPIPTVPGNMLITVTKFNRQPYVDTLQVIPASGPYLYCLNPVFDDQSSNKNGIPEAGETVNVGFSITNMGIEGATNVTATLSCPDTLVQIPSAAINLGSFSPGDTTIAGSMTVQFDPDMPHLTTCELQLHLEADGGHTWDQTLYVTVRKGAQIEILNAPLAFPDTYLNFTTLQTLRLKNNGPDSLRITDITSNTPQFSVTSPDPVIPPGMERSIQVGFTPEATQLYSGILTIQNNDPVNYGIGFSASGTGIYAPDITLLPDSISKTLNITDSVSVPVIIKNEGLGELTYNAQIAGHNPGSTVTEGSGGADNYGHIWIDSNEPGGPEFQWLDITQTGIAVAVTGNNSISNKLELGFDFPFYGENYNSFRACTNGWLSFTTFSVAYNNLMLPSNLAPRGMIAPLWDDLNFTTDSKLYFEEESNKAVILFENVYRVSGEGPFTFEAILYDNGNIVLQYLSLPGLLPDYTVGIQNNEADDGLTVAFNESYLEDSLAIMISKHSWATVIPLAGTIPAQSSDTLLLNLRTNNFPMGQFRASIMIESNDPDESICYLPIQMVVDSTLVSVDRLTGTAPRKFRLDQNWPNPFNPATTIKYSIPVSDWVELAVYNIVGQKVKTLVKGRQAADNYKIVWDGRNNSGLPVASGIYIYRLQTGKQVQTRKMILMR